MNVGNGRETSFKELPQRKRYEVAKKTSEDSTLTADIFALEKQRSEIEKRIREARNAKRKDALAQVRNLVVTFDLTEQELLSVLHRRPVTVNGPKYRDPVTGKTWTGQGKAPAWIKGAVDRTPFLIDADQAAANGAISSRANGTASSDAKAARSKTASTKSVSSKAASSKAAKSSRSKAESTGLGNSAARMNISLEASTQPQASGRPTLSLRKDGPIGIR